MPPLPAVSKSRTRWFCRTIVTRESNWDCSHWRVLAVFPMDTAMSVESCWNLCKEVPPVAALVKPVVSPNARKRGVSTNARCILWWVYILVKARRYYSRPDLCGVWHTLGSKFLTKKVVGINKLYPHIWSRHNDWAHARQQNGFAKEEHDFHRHYNWNMA